MALTKAEREAFLKREEAARKREKKEREPTIGGSIKEGAKAVGRGIKGAAKKAIGGVAKASPYSGAGDAARKRRIERETK